MKNLVIYRVTNAVTGENYIGQTRRGLAQRRSLHLHRFKTRTKNHSLYRAMRRYGVENFEFSVVCHCLKPEYLGEIERHFIKQFDAIGNGYNSRRGGDVTSDETRQKISKALKGRTIHWKDKLWETRRQNPHYRPAREYIPSGADSKLSKSYLIRFPDGKEERITGINQFCKEHGLTAKCLYDVLAGKQRHHKGFSLLEKFND